LGYDPILSLGGLEKRFKDSVDFTQIEKSPDSGESCKSQHLEYRLQPCFVVSHVDVLEREGGEEINGHLP
jgi:hypothetical protein